MLRFIVPNKDLRIFLQYGRDICYWALILICFVFISCDSQAEKYVKKWHNKIIQIPNDLSFYKWGTMFMNYNFDKSQYKMLALLDTVSCIGCQLKLDDWRRFIVDVDSISKGKIAYLFIVSPISKQELHIELKEEKFEIPICFDNVRIRKINDIPDKGTHVFLLDSQNRVVCVGNPIVYKGIEKLYKNILNGVRYEN